MNFSPGGGKTLLGVEILKSKLAEDRVKEKLGAVVGETRLLVIQGQAWGYGRDQLLVDLEKHYGVRHPKSEFMAMEDVMKRKYKLEWRRGDDVKNMEVLLKKLNEEGERMIVFFDEVNPGDGDFMSLQSCLPQDSQLQVVCCIRPFQGEVRCPSLHIQLKNSFRQTKELREFLGLLFNKMFNESILQGHTSFLKDHDQGEQHFATWVHFNKRSQEQVETKLTELRGLEKRETTLINMAWDMYFSNWCSAYGE